MPRVMSLSTINVKNIYSVPQNVSTTDTETLRARSLLSCTVQVSVLLGKEGVMVTSMC